MRSLLFLAALLSAACATPRPASAPCAPPTADDDWAVVSPADSGFDEGQLCAVLEGLSTSSVNLHSVLLERHGALVAELYRAGPDRPINSPWYATANDVVFDASRLHDVRSISKSVTSLLIGIAQARGKFPSLDSPVGSVFEELGDTPGLEQVTVAQLLSMSTGLAWKEWGVSAVESDETALTTCDDQVRYVLARSAVAAPGERFNYNGGNTAVLAELLTRSTEVPLGEFAQRELFTPLGITTWEWAPDTSKRAMAHSGLRLRPRDLLKLGRLMLDHGRWKGQQLVPEAWVDEVTKPRIDTGIATLSPGDGVASYGRQWWLGELELHGKRVAWVQAVGNGGQRLLVVPELDVAIVLNGGSYGEPSIQAAENEMLVRLLETLHTE